MLRTMNVLMLLCTVFVLVLSADKELCKTDEFTVAMNHAEAYTLHIHWMRHGFSCANVLSSLGDKLYKLRSKYGKDPDLTDKGIKQAQVAQEMVNALDFTLNEFHFFGSSCLTRAYQTLQSFTSSMESPILHVMPFISEDRVAVSNHRFGGFLGIKDYDNKCKLSDALHRHLCDSPVQNHDMHFLCESKSITMKKTGRDGGTEVDIEGRITDFYYYDREMGIHDGDQNSIFKFFDHLDNYVIPDLIRDHHGVKTFNLFFVAHNHFISHQVAKFSGIKLSKVRNGEIFHDIWGYRADENKFYRDESVPFLSKIDPGNGDEIEEYSCPYHCQHMYVEQGLTPERNHQIYNRLFPEDPCAEEEDDYLEMGAGIADNEIVPAGVDE